MQQQPGKEGRKKLRAREEHQLSKHRGKEKQREPHTAQSSAACGATAHTTSKQTKGEERETKGCTGGVKRQIRTRTGTARSGYINDKLDVGIVPQHALRSF